MYPTVDTLTELDGSSRWDYGIEGVAGTIFVVRQDIYCHRA